MPLARLGAIDIAYEDSGDPGAPPILLVMGLGVPLVFWPAAFVERLVARGFRVVTFDNRDSGRSTVLGTAAPGALGLVAAAFALGRAPGAYTVEDMAGDAAGLLDALGLGRAHVVGASMGGMIAQWLAIAHPDRVASLVSASSSSGARGLPKPTPRVMASLFRLASAVGPAAEREALAGLFRASSAGEAGDPARFAALADRVIERGFHAAGMRRQLAAVIADTGRTARLGEIEAETLVIHGARDPLLPMAHGLDTARRISKARFHPVPGMGHDILPERAAELADLVADHCQTVESVA